VDDFDSPATQRVGETLRIGLGERVDPDFVASWCRHGRGGHGAHAPPENVPSSPFGRVVFHMPHRVDRGLHVYLVDSMMPSRSRCSTRRLVVTSSSTGWAAATRPA